MSKQSSLRKPKLPVLHRLIPDMPSEAYHGVEGTWSSSQLKLVIEDEEEFIGTYITKKIGKKSSAAFASGTGLHTKILEPHLFEKEVVLFKGRKWGDKFNLFAKKNVGRTIITPKELTEINTMAKAIGACKTSKKYLEGKREISLFIRLVVSNGKIYAPHYGKVMTRNGWESAKCKNIEGVEFIVKTRADNLSDSDFISDLKSTSGAATKKSSIQGSISKYKYDLSAAFYLDLFSLERPKITRFIWVFASKNKELAAPWEGTRKQILIGRRKWMTALLRMAQLKKQDWKIKSYLRKVEPLAHELTWLDDEESDANLL